MIPGGPIRLAYTPATHYPTIAAPFSKVKRKRKPRPPLSSANIPCPHRDCTKLFRSAYDVRVHMRVHTGERPYECGAPGCLEKLMWRSSLHHHRRSRHPELFGLPRVKASTTIGCMEKDLPSRKRSPTTSPTELSKTCYPTKTRDLIRIRASELTKALPHKDANVLGSFSSQSYPQTCSGIPQLSNHRMRGADPQLELYDLVLDELAGFGDFWGAEPSVREPSRQEKVGLELLLPNLEPYTFGGDELDQYETQL